MENEKFKVIRMVYNNEQQTLDEVLCERSGCLINATFDISEKATEALRKIAKQNNDLEILEAMKLKVGKRMKRRFKNHNILDHCYLILGDDFDKKWLENLKSELKDEKIIISDLSYDEISQLTKDYQF